MTSARPAVRMIALLVVLLPALISSVLACSKTRPVVQQAPERAVEIGVDFDAAWRRFRAAVVADDLAAIEALTQFPFHTRGQLDEAAAASYDRASFGALLSKLLDQDSGARAEPEPMRLFIQRTTSVADVDTKGGEVYLGAFVFEQTGDGWLFTRAFVDWE